MPNAPHIVLLGDSNTWIGGDDCSQPRGWNYWFARQFPHRSIKSYARSGATWTHAPHTTLDILQDTGVVADNNVVYNQVERLIAAHQQGKQPTPDLIIIAAGTNDVWFAKARPRALINDVQSVFATSKKAFLKRPLGQLQSLAQAMRYDCLLLQHAFPQAHIVLLSPLQSTAFPAERLDSASRLMTSIAQRLHLPLVRQDSLCCLRAADERQARRYTTDGTHTSVAGAQCNGEILAQHLSQLLR